MMNASRRAARINLKLLLMLAVGMGVLAGGAFAAHRIRKNVVAHRALAEGRAALDRRDWPEACKHLRLYLSKYPEDLSVLEEYAAANLAVQPLEADQISAAIGAYRRLLRRRPDDGKFFRELTRLYVGVGNVDDAAYTCRQRLQIAPNDDHAMLWLARALIEQRRPEEAVKTLEELVIAHPAKVPAYVLLSDLALAKNRTTGASAALQWLDRAVESDPNSAEALVQRARCRRMVGESAEAAYADLQAASNLPPDDPTTLLRLTEEWLSWGQYDRATAALESLRRLDAEAMSRAELEPDVVELLRLTAEGQLALLRENREEGADLADRALSSLNPRHRALFLPLAVDLFLAAHRVSDARRLLDEHLQAMTRRDRGPDDVRTALMTARVLDAEGKPYEVIAVLEPITIDKAVDAAAWRLLAEAYERIGRGRRARETLLHYVERAPKDREAILKLAASFRGTDWEQVRDLAARALHLKPTMQARLLALEAEAMLADGKPDEPSILDRVTTELINARNEFPRSVAPRLLLSKILSNRNRHAEAIAELEAAIRETDESLAAELPLINLIEASGADEEAVDAAKRAVARHPQAASLRLALARLHEERRQIDEARQVLEQSVQQLSQDDRRSAQYALARFLQSRREIDAAAAVWRQLAAERANDVQARLALLALPSVRKDRSEAKRLIDEIRAAEGERGLTWKLHQALWLLDGAAWRSDERRIRELLEEVMRAEPGWDRPALALATLFERLGRSDQAESTYQSLLGVNAGCVDAADRWVKLLERQGRFADAQQVLERFPTSAGIQSAHRIAVAVQRGNYDLAIAQFEQRRSDEPDNADLRVQLASLLYERRHDRAGANRLLEEAASIAPDSLAVLRARAWMLHREGKTDEAVDLLNHDVEARADFDAYHLRAQLLTAMNRTDLAERDYVRLSAWPGSEMVGYALLGRFLEEQGRLESALQAWEAALKLQPDHVGLQKALAKGLLKCQDPSLRGRGREQLADLMKRFPDDADLQRLAAALLLEQGTSEAVAEAEKTLERNLSANPTDIVAHLQRVTIARQRGDAERARSLLSVALSANPTHRELRLVQVDLELDEGNASVARGLAQSLLDDHSVDQLLPSRLAEIFLRADELDAAAHFNQIAIQRTPNDESANLVRARIALAGGDEAGALEIFEQYLASESGRTSSAVRIALARLLTERSEFAVAERHLVEASSLGADPTALTIERLRLLFAQNRFDEAISLVSSFRADASNPIPVLSAAAEGLLRSGVPANRREARILFEEVVHRQPQNVTARIGLAQAAYQLGDIDDAVKAYRYVLNELSPNHPQATNDLAWLLAHHGGPEELAEAEKLAAAGVAQHPRDVHLLDTRGVILRKLGRLVEARRDFERCTTLAETQPATLARAWLNLARVLADLREDPSLVRTARDNAQAVDRAHQVLTAEERAESQSR